MALTHQVSSFGVDLRTCLHCSPASTGVALWEASFVLAEWLSRRLDSADLGMLARAAVQVSGCVSNSYCVGNSF